ncbi:MAG: amidophosphoribosyltransferase [Phycisphaerales bacterium]|nr:MAG: amidophosphoribosyltransferase [Phycisphaerales bacterium]
MRQDKPGHYCGLFGVFGHPDAARLTYLGLFAQQHRGQESAGICTTDGTTIKRYAKMGLVTDVFGVRELEALANPVAIGHVRYSTAGCSDPQHCQPLLIDHRRLGQIALAHNGTLINAHVLRAEYEEHGHIFQTTGDSEIILHMLARPRDGGEPGSIPNALAQVDGGYSLLMLFPDRIVAVRDPRGFRPLCIGRLDNGAYAVASETIGLDLVDAEHERDVNPGEIVTINKRGLHSETMNHRKIARKAQCIFELIYFADPASNVFTDNVHMAREAMGRQLARESPVDADLVIPVPNCARCAALGYSKESGIELGRGFTTSHYAGRSFILPEQQMRDLAVKMKLSVIKNVVRGKRLIVVEDSVVRGTTTRGKMGALRKAGAKEIHLRVASPPIRHPCHYGIDFPDPTKLTAAGRTVEQVRQYLEVDSLQYLSIEGMLRCVHGDNTGYCTACFSGEYPTELYGQES